MVSFFKNMKDRFFNIGTWEHEIDIYIYVFSVVSLFVIPFNFVAFVFCSLVSTGSINLLPSRMTDVQQSLNIFYFLATIFAIVCVSLFIVRIYKKIIFNPVSDFNKELADIARNEISEYYTNGKMSRPFRDPFSAITWQERVRYYIDSASSDKYIDELTGCFNRKYFSNKFVKYMHLQTIAKERQISKEYKHGTDLYAVFMIDIDHFKSVNDDYGHAAGDVVLRSVGKLLRELVGDNGVVIRNGGEEFVIIYLAKSPFDFAQIAEKINQAFRDSIKVTLPNKGFVRDVTCSVGFVNYPIFPNADLIIDLQSHIDLADAAMYLSKTNGRDRWHQVVGKRETTDKIDLASYVNSPEYGMKRGYYVIRTSKGECSDLNDLSAIE